MNLSLLFLKTFYTLLKALFPIWGVLAVTISALGVWVGMLEDIGWLDGFYFGWITATTVGYGDIVPSSSLTRIISIVISLIGIVNTGMIVSIAVAASKRVLKFSGSGEDVKRKVQESLDSQ
jgi:voltage-gated potassium channel